MARDITERKQGEEAIRRQEGAVQLPARAHSRVMIQFHGALKNAQEVDDAVAEWGLLTT